MVRVNVSSRTAVESSSQSSSASDRVRDEAVRRIGLRGAARGARGAGGARGGRVGNRGGRGGARGARGGRGGARGGRGGARGGRNVAQDGVEPAARLPCAARQTRANPNGVQDDLMAGKKRTGTILEVYVIN